MKASAPNLFSDGFQSEDVMKLRPSALNAGHAWRVVAMAIPARMTSTRRPDRSVRPLKMLSPRRPPVDPSGMLESTGASGSGARSAREEAGVIPVVLAHRDLVELGDCLGGQRRRQSGEVGALGQALALGQEVGDPALEVVRRGGVLLG